MLSFQEDVVSLTVNHFIKEKDNSRSEPYFYRVAQLLLQGFCAFR